LYRSLVPPIKNGVKGILINEEENVYRCVRENEEIVTRGEDVNAETPEQLEQERAQVELGVRYEVFIIV